MFFYLHELNTRKGATVNGPESSANLFHRAFAFSEATLRCGKV